MLLALISQLKIGMDLHKVTLPVFVLESRSMLERVTDFMSHVSPIPALPSVAACLSSSVMSQPDLVFGCVCHRLPEHVG